MGRRIAVLVHHKDDFRAAKYLLSLIVREWESAGHDVMVVPGPEFAQDADCAVLHVNLTEVPGDYLAGMARYPIVINGATHDISKRRISNQLVSRGDAYGGPVIVKTNRNYGGIPESYLADRSAFFLRAARRLLPWRWMARLQSHEYPIYDAPSQVPPAAWRDPSLAIERFLPERRDGFYCLRTWLFFGDRDRNTLSFSRQPIVKATNVDHDEPGGDVPEELRAMRRRLGFDYGKFDYALVDGHVILYDANRTPGYTQAGAAPKPESLAAIRDLARGLDWFLARISHSPSSRDGREWPGCESHGDFATKA